MTCLISTYVRVYKTNSEKSEGMAKNRMAEKTKSITVSFSRKLSEDIREILEVHGYDSLRDFVNDAARRRYEELTKEESE